MAQVCVLHAYRQPQEDVPREQVRHHEDGLLRVATNDLEPPYAQRVADGVEHPAHKEGERHSHHEVRPTRPLERVHQAVQRLQAVDGEGDDHAEACGGDEDEEPLDDKHILVGLGGDHHEHHQLAEHEERHELHGGAAAAVRGHRDEEHEKHGTGEQPRQIAQPRDDCAIDEVHVPRAWLHTV